MSLKMGSLPESPPDSPFTGFTGNWSIRVRVKSTSENYRLDTSQKTRRGSVTRTFF